MSKECFRCHEIKPLRDFYRHPKMADGRLGKCKVCTKNDVTANRCANILHYREYDKERNGDSERIAAIGERTKQWRRKNPRKWAAQIILNNAIHVGKLQRRVCAKCGKKAHAHHENYDYPLDVIWLCAIHHSERHMELKKQGIET